MLTRHHTRVKAFTFPRIAVVACVCCLALPSMAAGTYYRWVNKDGSTEYTIEPPPKGVQYTEVSPLGVGKGRAPATAKEVATTQESGADATKGEGEEAAKPKKDPKTCRQAKSNLATLEAHTRVRLKDENGQPYILSEEQRQKEIKRAKDAIDKNC